MFSPASSQAHAITTLILVLFAICAAIFLLVFALVVVGAVRYRDRGGDHEPRQTFGNTRVEILWTAGPLALVAVLFALSVAAARASDPPTPSTAFPDVRIVGHQWWWEVQYPRDGVVTANEIHIPAGRAMVFEVDSGDVIHDFWVPELGRKIDMVPGHPTRLRIQADAPGTYAGACAEYCGAEHAWMRLRVVSEPTATFADWVAHQRAAAQAPRGGPAREGARLFSQLTCSNCHAVAGTEYDARVGPDLTHVATRARLAGELIDNTPDNLSRWIAHPDVLKPSSHMPNLHLSRSQVDALVAYLETLR